MSEELQTVVAESAEVAAPEPVEKKKFFKHKIFLQKLYVQV